MDPTTMTVWLYVLSGLVLVLIVVMALDLKREWNRTASDLARRLIRNAAQEAELDQLTGPHRVTEPSRPPTGAAGASMPEPPPVVADFRRRPDLLVPPPMVGNDTLRDWLLHYRQTPEAWMDVTEEFYARAAQAPEVADYFTGVDWPALKRHFMAALVLLTHTGVTRELPATAARWHQNVRNSAGDPITPEIFDAVIDTLVGVLRDFDVPADTLHQLGRVVAPFRMAIARMPAPAAEATARAAWPSWRDQRGPSVNDGGA